MTKRLVLTGIAASMLYCSPLFAQADITLKEAPEAVTDFYDEDEELYGLEDENGKVILDPAYEIIYPFYGGYAKVEKEDLTGLIDEKGELILPLEYDDILVSCYLPVSEDFDGTGFEAFGYFAVEKDGKIGFAKEGGDPTCEISYSSEDTDVKGASAVFTDESGEEILLAADGKETDLSGYRSVNCLNYSAGALYQVEAEDGKYGVIDWHGEEVLPCAYTSLFLTPDGIYLTAKTDYTQSVRYEVSYDLSGF